MNETAKIGVAAAVALVGGLAVGRLWPRGEAPVDGPRERAQPRPEPARVEPIAARPHDPATAERCQDAQVELQFLKARQSAARTRDEVIRRPFSDGTEREQQLAWTELAEAVIAACVPEPLALEFIECSEYPCVAVLADPRGDASVDVRRELEYAASERLEDCAPLRAAFGEGYPVEVAAFIPFPTSCPDGEDEQAWVLLLMDPDGDAIADFASRPVDPREAARIERWIYRRADDIDKKWMCANEASPDAGVDTTDEPR